MPRVKIATARNSFSSS